MKTSMIGEKVISMILSATRRVGASLHDRSQTYQMELALRQAGVGNVHQIPTHMKVAELRALYHLSEACSLNSSVLEIGSYLGASTCYLGAGLLKAGGHLFCVDTWNNETMPEGELDTYREFRHNIGRLKTPVYPIRKNSIELVGDDLRLPLSLVFLDADHSYSAVKHDVEKVIPWIDKNGIVVFHDFGNQFTGVSCVVGELLASSEWVMKGKTGYLCWIQRSDTRMV